MNSNSLNGSIMTVNDSHEVVEEHTDKKPVVTSFIDLDILKELQRELHLLDVENEFDVKVKLYLICDFYIIFDAKMLKVTEQRFQSNKQ